MLWTIIQLIIAALILVFGVLKAWYDIRKKKSIYNIGGDILIPLVLAFLLGIEPVIQLLKPSEVKEAVKPITDGQKEIKEMIRQLPGQIGEPLRYDNGIPQSENLNLRKLFEEGKKHFDDNEFDKAIKALRTGTVLQDVKPSELAALLIYIGLVQHRQGSWDEAKGNYKEALNWAEKDEDYIGQGVALVNIGLIHQSRGEWDKSLELMYESLSRFEKAKDEYGIIHTYGNLGIIYSRKRDSVKAEEFHRKALSGFVKFRDEAGQARTLANIGSFFLTMSVYDTAIVYYDSSLKIEKKLVEEEIGDKQSIAQSYGNLGLVYYYKGDWKKARDYYEKSLQGFEEIDDIYGMALTKGDLALLYKTQGKKKEAKAIYKEILVFFEKIGDKPNADITRRHLKDLE